ncbi:GNAT family N-acetyltransferase [Actinomadura sp. PM05-2]|uniref:GNAT family N-acetyltransferase n=2 Tax=Actinomadura parmotrematis TaxID=2864039 RepID=A0ABS7FZ37_9ACTN|nr:GNAT family N-acetyltransferase [Actinomadura parmotrematis]
MEQRGRGPGGRLDDRLGELVAAAWPALHSQDMAGWTLRSAHGVTKRANSVLALGEPADPDAAIAAVERHYAALGLPPVFTVTGRSRPADLDARLAARGYAEVDRTLAMAADLGPGGADPEVEIADAPSPAWLDTWWSVDGRFPGGLAVAERILAGVPAGYASLAGAAVGRGVPQGEWLGVYAMAVVPEARRQGLARRVLRSLMAWGRAQGCRRAYLVVVEANAGARALYESEGFRPAGHYHYRVGKARRNADTLRS